MNKEISKWDYVGCGWFRANGYPIGKNAPIIHAPELVEKLFAKIAELENQVDGMWESITGEDI